MKMAYKAAAAASSSSFMIICYLFVIWLIFNQPVMSARILASTPSNKPSKIGVHGNPSPISHSSTGQSSPTSVAVANASFAGSMTVYSNECIREAKRGHPCLVNSPPPPTLTMNGSAGMNVTAPSCTSKPC
ncbi:unnamed protein product [Ilex paraguariensis]|uniref:Uncharacterized protein n=1 Tax=Ilex paraguariensis TaxID=185542 RepID=A0ABC8SZ47_9AQUA